MNLTAVFHPPSLNPGINSYAKEIADLEEDMSNVLTGIVPMIPIFLTSSFDATIPYTFSNMKMLVPCPKAIPGTEKVLETFSLTVWLTIGLVLLLTTVVFWCAGNVFYPSVCNETHTYQSLSDCFHNVWSVFVAVSVPRQPRSSTLRVLFFLYVCFCFAISTVFQAFFVSYLVEPKYERKLKTLDELQESDVVYGYHQITHYFQSSMSYPEFVNFLEHKKLKEDCSNIRKCIERMTTKRDIASIIPPFFALYVAREMGIVDFGKIVCSLEGDIISGGGIFLFKKGNPLLDRFNILMRRYLEAGLLESHWQELQHRASLRGGGRLREAAGDVFFAFSISHIMPAFVVLLLGTVLSSVVFIGELIVNCLHKRKEKRNSRRRRVRRLYYYQGSRCRYRFMLY
jgi:hypothetical protein